MDERLAFLVLHLAALGDVGGLAARPLDRVQIGEKELGLHDPRVAHRIGRSGGVRDVRILEAAHDVEDDVHLADVGEELVAEAFASAGPFDQTRDVDEGDRGGHGLLRSKHFLQQEEIEVGHGGDPHVLLDRAEGIVGGFGAGVGQRVQERRLADVGEPGDSHGKTHASPPAHRGRSSTPSRRPYTAACFRSMRLVTKM